MKMICTVCGRRMDNTPGNTSDDVCWRDVLPPDRNGHYWNEEDARRCYQLGYERASEALAAARLALGPLKAVAQAVIMFHSARVWDDAASEEWHRLTGQPLTTKGLCDFARAALAAPAASEEKSSG